VGRQITSAFFLLPSAFPSQKEGDRQNARIRFCLNFLRKLVYTRSVPAFPVSERKARALRERLDALRCSEKDLEESFFRRSGVDLWHRPTGVRIRCSEQSCQALNRFLARRMLADELEARLQKKTRHEAKAERIRKAKGKLKRPSATERLDQFALRPWSSASRQSPPKELGKLLNRLKNLEA
jgi:peptide chain release factor